MFNQPPYGSGFQPPGKSTDQWAGKVFVQRQITQENTLGLGVRDTHLIVQSVGACGHGYMQVRLTGRSIAGEGLAGTTPPAGTIVQGSRTLGSLQFRIQFSDGSPFDVELDLDGGRGLSIGTWAGAARVYLLRDAGTFVIPTPGVSPNQVTSGGQNNVFVSASINRIPNHPPHRGISTVSRLIPVSTNTNILIPPFSRRVQVLQDDAAPAGVPIVAAASGDWNFLDQNGNAIGILPFEPGRRFTEPTLIPDGAVFLRTDRDNAAQRFFSSIFEVVA